MPRMANVIIIYFFYLFILNACHLLESKKNLSDANLKEAASYNVQLGLAYLQQKEMLSAKQKLFLALHQAPDDALVLDAMAYFLAIVGDNKNAEIYYQKAIHYAADNTGRACNNYGVFLCRLKRYQAAEYYLLRAAKQPNYLHSAQAYENAGLCALKMSNQALAKSYFTEALRQNPRSQIAQSMLNLQNTSEKTLN